MRILLLTHYYEPEVGAPQRRWGGFVEHFVAAGHQITVMAPTPHYPTGRPEAGDRRYLAPGTVHRGAHGETVVRTGYLPHRGDMATRTLDHGAAAADAVRRALARCGSPRHRPDVIIATAPAVETLVAGSVLARRWKVPMVAEMRDAWPDLVTHVQSPTGHRGRRLGRPVARMKEQAHRVVTALQRDADLVVTTTERFADVLRGRGIEPVEVIRNGTDLASVPTAPPRSDDREALRIAYLGNLGRVQGLDMAIRAAARLRDEGVGIDLRLTGHGALAADLAALAARLRAPVRVSTRIPHDLVLEEYARADSILVSLRGWEPLSWTVPSKLYEVLATGRHVTGALAGEAAGIVEAAGAGDVVAPGDEDALVGLWRSFDRDRTLLVDGRGGGRDWVAQNADSRALAASYLALLEGIATPRR